MKAWLLAVLGAPVRDTYRGLDRCLKTGPRDLILILAGLLAGWWIYVPTHELAHAVACRVTGGAVTRLEIDPLYGGTILERVFPFVVSGGEYAGRLSGFDTRGSDLIYLATDLAPFLLTLFPGLWAFRAAGATGRGWLFALSLPFALAPFLSLTGDAYEIGSILVTGWGPWSAPEAAELIRGDDLFKKMAEIRAAGSPGPWMAMLLATLLGIAWAFLVYGVGARISRLLGRGPVPAPGEPPIANRPTGARELKVSL